MTTRREWAHTLAERAKAFDDLDDTEAETAIADLIQKTLGQPDPLFKVELMKARRERLGKRRKSKADLPADTRVDLADLIPPVVHVPNPNAAPKPKTGHPLGNRSLVSRKHQ